MNNRSQELGELFLAMAKAQGEMEIASRKNKNPYYKSMYADFSQLIRASRPYLSKNGLCVIQRVLSTIITEEKHPPMLSTVLGHNSGQWIESVVEIKPPKSDIQTMGSYITYLKRYSYAAIVGVATGDDDDGEGAMHTSRETGTNIRKKNGLNNTETISKEQVEILHHELKDDEELATEILNKMGISGFKEMPKYKFMNCLKRIRELLELQKSQ